MHVLTSLLFFSVFLAVAVFFRATLLASRYQVVDAVLGNAPVAQRYVRIEIVKGPVARHDMVILPIIAAAHPARSMIRPFRPQHSLHTSPAVHARSQDFALAA